MTFSVGYDWEKERKGRVSLTRFQLEGDIGKVGARSVPRVLELEGGKLVSANQVVA